MKTVEEIRAYKTEHMRRWRLANPEKVGIAKERRRERDVARRLADPEAWAAANRKWYDDNPDRRFEYQLVRKYGITRLEFDALLEKQGGVCAICRLPAPVLRKERTIRRLWVDHSHETGKVRGLLCNSCNSLIGLAREDESILEAAIYYLGRDRILRAS